MHQLLKNVSTVVNKTSLISFSRLFSKSSPLRAYEGPGKSVVTILNKEQDSGIMIDAFSTRGFRLNNNITILGAAAIFPRSILSWSVGSLEDISEESLSLFLALEPKLDILVLGCGNTEDVKHNYKLAELLQRHKINYQLLTTEHACSTFNFLCSEGRNVAAGLIPPSFINVTEDDMFRSGKYYKGAFNASNFTN